MYPTLDELNDVDYDKSLSVAARILNMDYYYKFRSSSSYYQESLCTIKIDNIDMQWKDVVEGLLGIREYELANNVCLEQG